jgi:hypothetical protein
MKKLLGCIDATRIGLTILMATLLAIPAGADPMYQLNVTYTNGAIVAGPLSFGLSTLPTSVSATFILGPGQPGTEPGEEDDLYFDDEDLLAATVAFGDATWIENNLAGFDMMYDGNVNGLTYLFSPIDTQYADSIIIMNFPLRVIGTDIASGQPFEYIYADSTQTLTEVPLIVAIDIKPGSNPNCFNINGHGVIPVAILGSETFDASQIDLASLSFGGLEVRVRGNKGPLCSIESVDADIYPDLVCHFEDNADNWQPSDGEATLTGTLLDGTPFEGTDSICIVP